MGIETAVLPGSAPISLRRPRPEARAPSLEGERRRVTIVFADIVGFTHLTGALGPEQARDLVNACFEYLVPIIQRHGGTVDKFIGDAIMALFGAPIAHENDPERALRCALDMREALARFNAARGTRLAMHVGINTGLVIAGGIGTRDRLEYSVVGDAANVASRLQQAARRDEILVGPDAHRLTGHRFDFQAVAPLQLKGKDEPVPAYRLLGASAGPLAPGALEAKGIRSPLIGRDSELATLVGCVERLRTGRGGIVSVLAEAGLGKSRLVAEVRRRTARGDLTWLEGHALSFGQNISYWPFREIVQSDAGIGVDDDEGERWAKLEARVRALIPAEAADCLPYLAALLAIDLPDALAERVRYLDGEAMGRQVFRAARRYFAGLAQERPLVLVFEDVHWVDESSMLLLEHLGPLLGELPILVVGVGRPDPDSPAAFLLRIAATKYSSCYTDIRLSSLSRVETSQLVQSLLGSCDLSPRVLDGILRKTEGNPFYVEEVIRALIDFGGLQRDSVTKCWRATAHADEIPIPDTLQGVILARLDRLDEGVKQVLRNAAVIGRSFHFSVLRGLDGADRPLDREIRELQRLQIVVETGRHPELEYAFKHALVRTAAYESILVQRRRTLHRQVAECVERLFADRLDELYGLLAYHYTMAEEWPRARRYLLAAADQSAMLAADAEALNQYRQALETFSRAAGAESDALSLAVLERKVGEALFRRGFHEQAREHLHRALRGLGSPYPESAWGIRAATGREIARRIAGRLLSRFLRGSQGQADAITVERCRIYWSLVWIDYFNDPNRLLLDAVLMWSAAEAGGLDVHVAQASSILAVICDAIPLSPLAERFHSRAVTLAERTRQPMALGLSYMGLALHEHYGQGEWDLALEHYHQAASAFRESGDLRRWAATSSMLAVLLGQRGEIQASLDLAREIVRTGEDSGDQEARAWGLGIVAFALDEAGVIDEAVATLRPAVAALEDLADYQSAVGTQSTLARCYLRQGRLAEAMAVLRESRRLIAEHRLRGFLCTATCVTLADALVMAAARAGDAERADVLREARAACRAALRHAKFDLANLVAAYRVQGSCDWLDGSPRSARKWWQRGLRLAERLGARYEEAALHLEIGRRTGDVGHLVLARAAFADMGARFDLAQARKLLRRHRRQGRPPHARAGATVRTRQSVVGGRQS